MLTRHSSLIGLWKPLKWFLGLASLLSSSFPWNSSCLGWVGEGSRNRGYLLTQPTSDDTRFKTKGLSWSVKTEPSYNLTTMAGWKEVKQQSLLLQDFMGNPEWGLHSASNVQGDKATEAPGNLQLLHLLRPCWWRLSESVFITRNSCPVHNSILCAILFTGTFAVNTTFLLHGATILYRLGLMRVNRTNGQNNTFIQHELK